MKLHRSKRVEDAEVIVMGIPCQHFRQVLLDAKPYIRPWVPIISLAKGLEQGTLFLSSPST